jgi:hypothetical protein
MKRIAIKIFLVLIVACSIVLCIDYIGYRNKKVINVDISIIEDIQAIEDGEYLIDEIIPFEWDEIHIFEPYISDSHIYQRVGKEYTTASNYLSYKIIDDHTGLWYDHLKKMVIMNKGVIIYDINYNRLLFDFKDSFYASNEVTYLYKKNNRVSLYK